MTGFEVHIELLHKPGVQHTAPQALVDLMDKAIVDRHA
jgi:hypothetical protein